MKTRVLPNASSLIGTALVRGFMVGGALGAAIFLVLLIGVLLGERDDNSVGTILVAWVLPVGIGAIAGLFIGVVVGMLLTPMRARLDSIWPAAVLVTFTVLVGPCLWWWGTRNISRHQPPGIRVSDVAWGLGIPAGLAALAGFASVDLRGGQASAGTSVRSEASDN